MNISEPNRELDEWIGKNIVGLKNVEAQFVPTVNVFIALSVLEDFMQDNDQFSHVEMGYEWGEDGHTYSVRLIPVDKKTFHPFTSYYELAFAICVVLWYAVTEGKE